MDDDDVFDNFMLMPKRFKIRRNVPTAAKASSNSSVSVCSARHSRLSLSQSTRPVSRTVKAELNASVLRPSQTMTLKRNGATGFCASCGLPARMLVANLEKHSATCNKQGGMTEVCPQGESCPSTLIRHFRNFRHATPVSPVRQPLSSSASSANTMSNCPTQPNKTLASSRLPESAASKSTPTEKANETLPSTTGKKRRLFSLDMEAIVEIVNSEDESELPMSGRTVSRPSSQTKTGNAVTPASSKPKTHKSKWEYNSSYSKKPQNEASVPKSQMPSEKPGDKLNRDSIFEILEMEEEPLTLDASTVKDNSNSTLAQDRSDISKQVAQKKSLENASSQPFVKLRRLKSANTNSSPSSSKTIAPALKSTSPVVRDRSDISEQVTEKLVNGIVRQVDVPSLPNSQVSDVSVSLLDTSSGSVNPPSKHSIAPNNFIVTPLVTPSPDPMFSQISDKSVNLEPTFRDATSPHWQDELPRQLSQVRSRRPSYETDSLCSKTTVHRYDNQTWDLGTDYYLTDAVFDHIDPGIHSQVTVPWRRPSEDNDLSNLTKSQESQETIYLPDNIPDRVEPVKCVKSSIIPCEVICVKKSPGKVNANVSVCLTSNDPCDTTSGVKIDATCDQAGWSDVKVEVLPNSNFGTVDVQLCECSQQLKVGCNVTETSTEGINSFRSTMREMGLERGERDRGGKMVQMSILSYMGGGAKKAASDAMKMDTTEKEKRLERARESKSNWLTTLSKQHSSKYPSSSSSSSLSSRWSSSSNTTRTCPFYRKIPGTRFAVDAFNYGTIPGVTSYFLSHFHSDHYIGLKRSFNQPIYCSSITASLVQLKIKVAAQFLRILPLDTVVDIEGVKVTALEANHCPGSVMFLFRLRDGRNYLHVGDFRATPLMESYPSLWNTDIHTLFLDTTYCSPKYVFPPQEEAVTSVVQLVLDHVSRNRRSRTLVVCGAYLIGKEKVFLGIAEALDCKVWAEPARRKVLRLLEDPGITSRLVDDPHQASVHVDTMQNIRHDKLKSYLARFNMTFGNVVGVKPTGWEFTGTNSLLKLNRIKDTAVVGVPYSEHSSFSELQRFVKFLRPTAIVPTVNVGLKESRDNMARHYNAWLAEAKRGAVR